MRSREHARRVLASIAALVVFAISRAEGAGRLTGKVIDEKGEPVTGIALRLVPDPGPGANLPPVKVKNGKFIVPNFPRGTYRVEVEGDSYSITHFSLDVRGGDGARLGQLDVELPIGTSPPPFEISSSQRASLTLTLGAPLKDAQGRTVGIQAAVATSSTLGRLNDLLAKGDMERLRTAADEALRDDPRLGGAHYLRGVALWKLGSLPEAVDAVRTARDLVPDQPGIDGVLGAILIDLGDRRRGEGDEEGAEGIYLEAAEAYGRAIEKDPTETMFLTNRVIAFDRAGRSEETISALEALLTADPGNRKARYRLAEVLTAAGRAEEALAALDGIEDPDRDTAIAMYNAAVKLFNTGNLAPIVPAMTKAVRIAPDVPEPHQLLGRVLLNQGDVEGAVRELEEFVRLAPDDPDAAADRELIERIR